MNKKQFNEEVKQLFAEHEKLIKRKNKKAEKTNGVFYRYKYPILTAEHSPIFWRYDLNQETNPYLMERQGMNCAFNAGAMLFKGKYVLSVRAEGVDRKSFFAIAESPNGIDNFKFWDYPITLPETEDPDTNVYDMRLTNMKTAGFMVYSVPKDQIKIFRMIHRQQQQHAELQELKI